MTTYVCRLSLVAVVPAVVLKVLTHYRARVVVVEIKLFPFVLIRAAN